LKRIQEESEREVKALWNNLCCLNPHWAKVVSKAIPLTSPVSSMSASVSSSIVNSAFVASTTPDMKDNVK
jgi:hypothetical protein